MELIIKQERTQNLSNFFLLPLIRRSGHDFLAGKFVNSYLDIESFHVVVEVEIERSHFKDYAHYDFSIEKDGHYFYFYKIPEQFHEDVACFVDGKYSQFSEGAKTYIRKYSRLPFKYKADGSSTKSVWLHVIDKSDKLRRNLEQALGVTLSEDVELAEKPSAHNYFNQ